MHTTPQAQVTVVYDPDNGDEIAKELGCDHAAVAQFGDA
ncbi:hypothetical protein [Testudinibacter sp. TR-2022]|nr:hypothetical protein [Testudinibacter sp. TR-2022]